MSRESSLEKYIKDFVEYKCGDRVYLRLGDSIEIHSVSDIGSVTLASLWANVLQHKQNFPPAKYPYCKDKFDGEKRLVLETSGVKLGVNMANGRLTMEGKFVYDWFSRKFRALLDNFDVDFARSWVFKRTETAAGTRDIQDDNWDEPLYKKSETEAYMLMESRGQPVDAELERKMQEHSVYLVAGFGDMSAKRPVWTQLEVERQLEALRRGGVYCGLHYILPLWRSFLHWGLAEQQGPHWGPSGQQGRHWGPAGQQGRRVYLSTALLDADRLQEVVEGYLTHRLSANLQAFYTPFHCDPPSNVNAIQKKVLSQYNAKHQTLIEYSIYRRMIYPLNKLLANFIAVVDPDGTVHILLLGCSFHGSQITEDTMTTAAYFNISEQEFKLRYLNVLEKPAVSSLSL